MISIYQFKPRFQALLRPIARAAPRRASPPMPSPSRPCTSRWRSGPYLLALYGEQRQLFLPFVAVTPFGWGSIGAVVFPSALSEMAAEGA